MSLRDVALLHAGVVLLAGARFAWRRGDLARLGTSAPMTIGALLVLGVGCIVVGLSG